MTSAWAFRKAISNLHFDLVVSKLLKITAALSWNQNMLAAPQDLEQKPHIYPRRKLERRIKPERGKLTFFFMIPLFPLCTHPQTHSDGKGMPPPWRRFCQPPLTRSSWQVEESCPGRARLGQSCWQAGGKGGLFVWDSC